MKPRALHWSQEAVDANQRKRCPNRANGGHARAAVLSSERRVEIAKEAVAVRWSKYRNQETRGYASKKEAARAQELSLLQIGGKIRNLREQVPYELIPAQFIAGKCVERSVVYIADFCYEELERGEWRDVTEDSKGVRTPDYILKRKMMLWLKGIRIRET